MICPLCKDKKSREFIIFKRKNKTFRVVKCISCGMSYMNPRPKTRKIMEMYSEEYFNGKGFDESINYVEGLKSKDAWNIYNNDRARVIEKWTSKGKILDVGCGLGEFLDVAKKRKWKTYGVEISKFSSDFANKRFKVNAFNGTLKQARYDTGMFDAITMVEVIEHLEEPLAELRECNRILKNGGVIVVQTGNIDGLYARLSGTRWFYYLAGHLNYFSKKTIRKALEKSGFEILKIYNGDEISFSAHSRRFWYYEKVSLSSIIRYVQLTIIHIIRKAGFGGMTVYAKKA